jgi:DNA-binding cell septation regulator SpoVG
MKTALFLILFNLSAQACVATLLNGEPKTIEIILMERGHYKDKQKRAYFSVVLDGVLKIRDLFLMQVEGEWVVKLTEFEENFEMSDKAKELLKDQAKKLYENLLAEGKVLYKERSPEPEIKRIKVTILESEIANTQDKNHKYNFKMLFGNYLSVSGIRLYLGKKGFFLSYPGGEWFSRGKSNYAFFPLFTVTQDCLRDRALEIVSGANKDKSALSH